MGRIKKSKDVSLYQIISIVTVLHSEGFLRYPRLRVISKFNLEHTSASTTSKMDLQNISKTTSYQGISQDNENEV